MKMEVTTPSEVTLLVYLIWRIWDRYNQSTRRRRFWVRSIFSARRQQSQYYHLLQEMRLHDEESHFRYTRMSRRSFDDLLHKVEPHLARRRYTSSARPSISSAERLALTLRYLATGDSQTSISFNFRVGRSTVCNIVYETCWKVLHIDYVQFPSTTQDWIGISKQFWRKWNFPNCLGAIDGKHILIQAPSNSGSLFYNYKGTYSIVLLAVCDANYRFIAFDIGEAGKESDSGIFSNSLLGQYLESQSLLLPQPASVPDVPGIILPYVFVGDEGFPLRKDLMRPFPGKNLPNKEAIFNYRLSRARRIIENTFGILSARFRIFRQPINSNPDRVVAYAKLRLHFTITFE